jgi:tetratricopeptide (TPR) repeat protein
MRPGVVSQILTGDEGGQLPIEALVLPFRADNEGGFSLALCVEIDGASFLGSSQESVARVEVYAYALSEGARVVAHLAEMFAVDIGELGETIWQSGLKFFGGLELPPGKYELRILVRNAGSGALGSERLEIEVPGASTTEATLPPLTFGGPVARESWLAVRSPSLILDESGEYAFRLGAQAVNPAARAVLVVGREARAALLHVTGVRKPNVGGGAVVEFMPVTAGTGATAAANGGRVIATADATVLEIVGEGDESSANEVTFIPPDVPPGLYRARFSEGDSAEDKSAWTPVAVIGANTQERDLLWSDLRWMLQSRPSAQPSEAAPGAPGEGDALSRRERSGRAVRRLAKRYREVLEELTRGSFASAKSALFEMESEVLGRGDRKEALRLREAELTVARDLGKQSAEALLPLLRLHSEVGEQYRARRIFSLVAHARAMVELLAERHAEIGGSAALTARTLASQAGYLQEANLLSSSRRLFVRALEHDADTASALLGLAASFEKYAEYNFAIQRLQVLADLLPDSDEALLRLAINQARVGWVPRARQALEIVVGRDSGDWVWSLAVEELARIHLVAGNLAMAQEVLGSAARRRPEADGIRFMLGHVYDRQGRVDRSLELVSSVGTDRTGQPSARRRYDEWPRGLLEEDRRLLLNTAEAAIPACASALEKTSG